MSFDGISGFWVATATPLGADGMIDHQRLAAHGQWLFAHGVNGLVLFGTTGEGTSFAARERLDTVAALLQHGIAPERLALGTGFPAITDSIALTRDAMGLGLRQMLILPPYFYRDADEAGLEAAFATIIEGVADDRLRTTLYHIPQVSGVGVPPAVLARLRARFGAVLAGIKDSSGNFDHFRAFRAAAPEVSVTIGNEIDIGRAVAEGGAGTICGMANLVPDLVRAMFADPAAEPAMRAAVGLMQGSFVPVLKTALAALTETPAWRAVRAPLTAAGVAQGEAMAAQLPQPGHRQSGLTAMLELRQSRALLPTGHGLFESCHASTLVALASGHLLAAFFAGEREGAGDTAIWLSRCEAGEWLPPVRRFAEAGLAHWNPVLLSDGDAVWLFYKVGPSVHEWTTRIARSTDGGLTWTAPAPLVVGDTAPRGPVKNKLIVLSDGAWLAPASIEDDRHWDAFTDRSLDQGGTWTRADVPIDHQAAAGKSGETWQGLAANALWETDPARIFAWDGVIQPSLWESAPGQVHMLLRTTRGLIYRSDSADAGRSWCAAYPTALPNNNSGLDVVLTSSGALVLACNPVAGNWGRRSPISLLLSADNGASWTQPLHMQTRDGEFSYPAVIAAGNRLDITYTADRRTILHQVAAVV